VTVTSAEFSLALGTLSASIGYDVFCYNNAGVATLEFLAWTSSTTRATALTQQDGVLVKTGDATRRYLGSFYTTSTTTTADSGAKTSGRYLFNYYNSRERFLTSPETALTWNYSTATFDKINSTTNAQANFFVGVAEHSVTAQLSGIGCAGSVLAEAYLGIGLDSATVNSGVGGYMRISSTWYVSSDVSYVGIPSIGLHYLSGLMKGGTGTQTWRSDGGGLNVMVRA